MITIDEIVDFDNIEVYAIHGNEHYIKCPVCGRKKYKCSYNPQKGVWHCFHCDSKGGAIALHAAYTGLDYDEAKKQFLEGTRSCTFQLKKTFTENVIEEKRASDEICDNTYRDLVQISGLNSLHREDLLRRGLTEEDIKRFLFCDAPTSGVDTAKRLLNRGDILDGVPGFYENSIQSWTVAGVKRPGYLCPVFAIDGKIRGFQKRLDDPGDGQKYVWLSSSGRNKGVSSKAPSTFLKGKTNGVIIVTEGILKATVTYSLMKGYFTVIGVPGVKVINDLKSILSSGMIKKGTLIIEAFDMDKIPMTREAEDDFIKKSSKPVDICLADLRKKQSQIAKDTRKLHETIRSHGLNVYPLTWDVKKGKWNGKFKGIDDLLLKRGAPEALYTFLKKTTLAAQG